MKEYGDIEKRAMALAEPILSDLGFEFVDIAYAREGGRRILRLFMDKPGGITLDDCAIVSREFSTALDVEDFIDERYSLEVSSPGLDRPLVKEADFVKYAGRKARIKTKRPVEGRQNFKAVIEGVEGGAVKVKDSEGKVWTIEFSNIDRAKLEIEL